MEHNEPTIRECIEKELETPITDRERYLLNCIDVLWDELQKKLDKIEGIKEKLTSLTNNIIVYD